MEKKMYNLCLKILKRFNKAGILNHVILIGSWSIYFYRNYFKSKSYSSYIRTRDMDFLVPIPFKFKKNLNVFKLVEDLGFLEEYKGSQGYIKLKHPDLIIEFLVPQRGRGMDKPYPLPQLGINAAALRYLDFLVANTIVVDCNKLKIKLPHPAAYALHKFIIFKRRVNVDKHDRDIEGALRVFHELIKNNEQSTIKGVFGKMHSKWQSTVIKNLKSVEEFEVVDVLTAQ